jgi:hypothetical protein
MMPSSHGHEEESNVGQRIVKRMRFQINIQDEHGQQVDDQGNDEDDHDGEENIHASVGEKEMKKQIESIMFGHSSEDDKEEEINRDHKRICDDDIEENIHLLVGDKEMKKQIESIMFGQSSEDDNKEEDNHDHKGHIQQNLFLSESEVRKNIESVMFGNSSEDDNEDDEEDTSLDDFLGEMDARRRNLLMMFGTGANDVQEENAMDDGNEFHSDEENTDDHSLQYDSQEEGSMDSEFEVDMSSPTRRRTHIENEKRRQYNLFQLLPQLHRERIRLESMRIVGDDRECDRCHIINPPRLWRCNECSMLKHSSPRLCEECVVSTHLNSPHCMDVLYREETVFRKPFFHEMITFQLALLVCQSCSSTNCLQPRTMSIFIASQNGIFHCTSPEVGTMCQDCGAEMITGPIAFDCLPCEPVHQSGCTWFTNSLLSLIRTLRCEGGNSANALARAIMEHWLSRNAFLFSSRETSFVTTNAGTFPVPNITVHWLEKKLAQIMTTGILMEHPSWSDGCECFRLDDRLSSVCAACHDRCAQMHIDGFFKMRRMRRAKSFREPKLRFFCTVGKETVNGFRQIDLVNREEEVAMCEDLAGNLTEFRAGDGRQQTKSVGYSQTGILTGVCPHLIASAIIPMETKGEKFFMPHAMLDFFEGDNYSGVVDFYSYDVACRMKSYLQIRDPALHVKVEPKLVLGYFHSKSHRCHRWNVGYSKEGAGYNDGEQGERLNRLMLKYTSFLRYMREEHMQEAIEDFLMSQTRQANAKIDMVLRKKWINTLSHLCEWHVRFVRLCTELEDRLVSSQRFHLNIQEIQEWVEAYTTRPVTEYPSVEMTGSKAEQEYVWAKYEWLQLRANHTEAREGLQEINQLGEHIHDGLLHKKKYLLTVVKAYERMTKKRVGVSARDVLFWGVRDHLCSHNT